MKIGIRRHGRHPFTLAIVLEGALGMVTASISDSPFAENTSSGVSLFASTPAWTLTVDNNRIVDNANQGLVNSGAGTLISRKDNSIIGNGTDVTGTIGTLIPS